ncbi:hypothetical protein R5W24_004527 [Gemmata sp. JC717]|uniref:hypothetical protein n=1 Tax=Gemmata algarum TaxID=2975278 RepID=UPI0021BA661B|nr:hypothetical protein [Gemmata algarum]MDY3555384.1 hypothetical protein [Gemmata algarum]
MELLKRFVVGLGAGAAIVGLAMFALSVAPQSGAESAAQLPLSPPSPPVVSNPPSLVPSASLPPATPMPGADTLPAVGPSPVFLPPPPTLTPSTLSKTQAEPLPPGLAATLPFPTMPDVKPAKAEIAKQPLGRSAVRFAGPAGMKVSWLVGETFHDRDLTAPAAFNFVQGEVYRLRLTGLPKYPKAKFYPTMEVCAPSTRVQSFLGHNAIPISFTDAELATAAEGRLVVKAVYLPSAPGAESATTTEEVSSLRPGATGDPAGVASDRGSLLAVIRLGNVDLENPHSPPLHAPPATQLPEQGPMPIPSAP